MNSLIGVQDSTRADTTLVISPVPWLLLDIQSKETSLPLHTLKVNRMLLARMYNVKQKATTAILCRRVKLRSAQELCDFLTKNFSRPAVSSFPSRQKSVQLKRRVFFNLPSSGALSVSRNREGGRFCTVKVVDKKVYIFGGSSGSGFGGQHSDSTSDPIYLNDLFLLKVGVQVTWERLQQLGDIPCARDGHTLSALGSVLYLFGGSNYPESEECLEGLYAYDIGTLSWELCPTQGRQPKVLGHSAAVVGDTLYIFGGIHHGVASDALYILNTGNLTWTPLKASGKPPPARCDHACTVIGEKFYIMGGNGGEKLWYNDLHVFDTVTLRWESVNVLGHLPYARSLHTICAHHGKDIYLFGGSNDKAKVPTPFEDVYKLSMCK
ncbi:unnamed protein product [Porites evermanni]|uniref:Uncharacterized protein n=1 Tax=Porites evermanni TaxID=104178 RepID=A0ABN8QV92_9CNID|nr:unnamed protein product [Porites evermanni]